MFKKILQILSVWDINKPIILTNYEWVLSKWTGAVGFYVKFVCSPHDCVGFLWVLRLPSTVQNHV